MTDLLALSRAEHKRAKHLHAVRAIAHLGTFVASVVAVLAPQPVPYFAALAGVLTEVTALVWRIRGDGAHQLAERTRRHALLADALARSDAPDRASLELRFGSYARKQALKYSGVDYWSSASEPGVARLRDHTQESAFWSADLYRWAGRAALGLLLGPLVVGGLGVFVVVGFEEPELSVVAARIFAVGVLLFIAFDLLSRSLSWLNAAEMSKDAVTAFDRPTTDDLAGALGVYADYSVATATAPPIPDWIYRVRKVRIEGAWASRVAA